MQRSMIAGLCLAVMALVAAPIVLAPTAQAQVITVRPYTGVVPGSFADVVKKQNEMIRITLGMNFMLSGPGDATADDARIREKTRRSVYQIALRECDMIVEMIASECKIEAVNISLNRNPQTPAAVNVNANVTLRAAPK